MSEFVVVSATRMEEAEFRQRAPLGRSLSLLARLGEALETDLAFGNTLGLPDVYNRAMDRHASRGDASLLFVHDDVYLGDLFLFEKLRAGFKTYDLIGIAGSQCLDLDRPNVGWCECDPALRAGGVVHPTTDRQDGECYHIGYGPMPRECLAIDGVFMALKLSAARGARFDSQFPFDFYDLDFCLSLRDRGGRIGVLPILITHLSIGAGFGGPRFKEQEALFLAKHGRRGSVPPAPRNWRSRLRARLGPPDRPPGRGLGMIRL